MENDRIRVTIDPASGDIGEIRDLRDGRLLLRSGVRAFVRRDDGDTWAFNVSGYGEELGGFRLESSSRAEHGRVRSVIRTRARFRDSLLERDYLLYAGAESIECRFRVSWRERHAALKIGLDTPLTNPSARVAIPYGSVDRLADGREMPCGEWLDASDADRGVSLLSDSIFAYDMTGSSLNLTILRSPIYGHLTWQEPIDPGADWEFMEQGVREGRLRVVFHGRGCAAAEIAREAAAFSNPPITIGEASHPGELPRASSYLGVEGGGCVLTVLKRSEDGGNPVLRLVEMAGTGGEARIVARFLGRSYSVTMAPYEIKTLRLRGRRGRRLRETGILEE